MAARKAHNLEVPGSSPGPATKSAFDRYRILTWLIYMFYAYALENPKGVLYKGSTGNLEYRLNQHNGKTLFNSFTKKRGPWILVYYESFRSREEARVREMFFKTGKGREFLKSKIKQGS